MASALLIMSTVATAFASERPPDLPPDNPVDPGQPGESGESGEPVEPETPLRFLVPPDHGDDGSNTC